MFRRCRVIFLISAGLLTGCNLVTVDSSLSSRFIKTMTIPVAARANMELDVFEAESRELAGTKIVVEPGTFAETTTIALTLQRRPIAAAPDVALGPVAVLELLEPADAAIRKPLHVTLPMQLGTEALQDLVVLQALAPTAGGTSRIDAIELASPNAVTLAVTSLARFQVAARGCVPGDDSCGGDEACDGNGRCRFVCGSQVCAAGETCKDGICTPGCWRTCDSAEPPCLQMPGTCDPDTLRCRFAAKPAGAQCSEPGSCFSGGHCDVFGACIGASSRCGPNQHCADANTCACATGYLDCDHDSSNGCEFQGTSCPCIPPTAAALCADYGRNCGAFSHNDACGQPRLVTCGVCSPPAQCDESTNQCYCTPESVARLCFDANQECGPLTADTGCGQLETVECGTCEPGMACTEDGHCTGRPVNDDCTAAGPVLFAGPGSEHRSSLMNLASDDAQGSCLPPGGVDLVFAIQILTATPLQLDIAAHTESNWSPGLFIQRSCGDPNSEIAGSCIAGAAGTALLSTLLSPGTYYLWLEGPSAGAAGIVDLQITAHDP